jgi:hypothetical protein
VCRRSTPPSWRACASRAPSSGLWSSSMLALSNCFDTASQQAACTSAGLYANGATTATAS